MPIIPRHYIPFTAGDLHAALKLLLTGRFLEGDHGSAFAREFAAYIGSDAAHPVGSAREGLYLIGRGLALQPGDEVLVPSYYFFSTPISIKIAQPEAVIRFVPIDPDSYNIDTGKLPEYISGKTRAIIVQHTFGRACDMAALLQLQQQHRLALVEDCAQAAGSEYHGRKLGSFGDAAVFSFARGKNMTCGGGGMVTASNPVINEYFNTITWAAPSLAGEIKALFSTALQALLTRQPWYTVTVFPLLYLLNRINRDRLEQMFLEDEAAVSIEAPAAVTAMANWRAAIGSRQLQGLERLNQVRHQHAQTLLSGMRQLPDCHLPDDDPASFNSYYAVPIRSRQLPVIARQLMRRGIDMRLDYMKHATELCQLGGQVGYLPNHPGTTTAAMESLAAAVKNIVSGGNP